ncbi:MAG TPA: phenylalanine--tRNA ligase subunit beta, partial [Candidatus Dormibacteraeota bacterium]|nr:phenylalanine--tRNA ligase subunit beta [Candidatus Dormibacteraeota bacterium]
MKLPVEWTNVYLEKKLTARKLADTLELAGVEVEEIVQPGKLDTQIVVGETVAIDSHPNADKLKIVKVNVKNTTISVVCGAPNVALKQKVAVALPGAVLPNGLEIKNSSIRGVKSEGMICSEQELGLGSDHSGILVLPDNTKIGSGLGGVIKGRELIDLTSYPNRWDLNSVVGLAREAAAHSGQKVAFEEPEQIKSSRAPVVVKTPERDLVPRYMLAHLRVSNTGSSPDWMVSRLKAAGIRPISVVVDITNYVMLELGQPLHAFDAAKIMQPVSVRRAKKGEVMVTLDGVERKLDTEDLLISDKQKPLGFAGVMGGQNSETSADTTDILLESASFNAASVRKTAIRHGLRTEASARFERGIPVDLAPLALARAVQLLKDLASAELIAGPADLMSAKPEATQIVARLQRISNILGIELTAKEAADNLKKLGFEAHRSTEEKLSITVPWWRPDIKTEADLAEEVIKLIGYDKLPATLPGWKPQAI